MQSVKWIFIVLALTVVSSANAAEKGSGTGCNDIKIGRQGYTKAIQLGSKLHSYLERKAQTKQTRVVLLGRAG
jgi:hypothetical protein